MGLRDKLQAKLGKAFDTKLADAVNPFTGEYKVVSEYDPVTEEEISITVTYSGRGVLADYDISRVDGINIIKGDLQLIALVNEVTDKPKVDHVITAKDLITNEQQTYKVINPEIDPAAACYFIQVRRS
ncbi:MAG TPA: glutamate 5-kinase [Scandinavium sp.]|jgi:hypothetical protein